MVKKKIGFDLSLIADAFGINRATKSESLDEWLNTAAYSLTNEELKILDKIFDDITEDGDYWNEEELKIKAVGILFFLADIAVKNKIKIFYERPLSAVVNDYHLSVITDCMVATPMAFNSPRHPYFFLQEFKKGKGEKRDPEAQTLCAMLIAQHHNNENKPLFGGYLVGSNWRFSTLNGQDYCVSRQFDAANKNDLLQIVLILRNLKELILKR